MKFETIVVEGKQKALMPIEDLMELLHTVANAPTKAQIKDLEKLIVDMSARKNQCTIDELAEKVATKIGESLSRSFENL